MKSKLVILLSLVLSACVPVTELSIPADYTGPRASIVSTSKFLNHSEAILFYVQKIDDRYINDALLKAEILSRGTNSHLIADPQLTEVVVSPIKLRLIATKIAATGASFSLKTETLQSKDIFVTLQANQRYEAKGERKGNVVRLWLEGIDTGEIFE